MRLEQLRPAPGAVRSNKRVGRGEGSKKGGTAGRGHKGDQSRSGYRRNYAYEGGQMPLVRRVPKYGFKNIFRKEYVALNLDRISRWVEKYQLEELTPEKLYELRLIPKNSRVKVLGRGRLEKPVAIHAHAFSKKAAALIEEAGGRISKIGE